MSTGPLPVDDKVLPICSEPGIGSAAAGPRIGAFARSFDPGLEYSICDDSYGEELAEMGVRITGLLLGGCLAETPCPACEAGAPGCVPYPACDDGPAARSVAGSVLLRLTVEDEVTILEPCLDYDLRPDPLCAGGFRLDLDPGDTGLPSVPGGAWAEVIYNYDGCAACPR